MAIIVAIGKAGNPALMAGVHPQLMVGASTEVIAGEGLIVTPGGIDRISTLFARSKFLKPCQRGSRP